MREYLGSQLPKFTDEEKKFMKNSIDFMGINHYSAIYAKDCTNSSCSPTGNHAITGFLETVSERDGVLIGENVKNCVLLTYFGSFTYFFSHLLNDHGVFLLTDRVGILIRCS